jgi:heme-degrading monooxygenase HmoA
MGKILIDKFIVPEPSKASFLESAHRVQRFLKTLPGFVEGFLYEKKEGEGQYNYMTTAVWESERAFNEAKSAVATEFSKEGIDPQKVMNELKIERERAVYERSHY